MKKQVHTDSAREVLDLIDEFADLCIFHATVRENAERTMKPTDFS